MAYFTIPYSRIPKKNLDQFIDQLKAHGLSEQNLLFQNNRGSVPKESKDAQEVWIDTANTFLTVKKVNDQESLYFGDSKLISKEAESENVYHYVINNNILLPANLSITREEKEEEEGLLNSIIRERITDVSKVQMKPVTSPSINPSVKKSDDHLSDDTKLSDTEQKTDEKKSVESDKTKHQRNDSTQQTREIIANFEEKLKLQGYKGDILKSKKDRAAEGLDLKITKVQDSLKTDLPRAKHYLNQVIDDILQLPGHDRKSPKFELMKTLKKQLESNPDFKNISEFKTIAKDFIRLALQRDKMGISNTTLSGKTIREWFNKDNTNYKLLRTLLFDGKREISYQDLRNFALDQSPAQTKNTKEFSSAKKSEVYKAILEKFTKVQDSSNNEIKDESSIGIKKA